MRRSSATRGIRISTQGSRLILLAVSGLTLTLSGCVAVPAYDSKTDDMLTSLQKDTDSFIVQLSDSYDSTHSEGKACAYPANIKTYQAFDVDINLLKTRAEALYDNAATVAAVSDLQNNYNAFQTAHEAANARPDHCILPALLNTDQQALDSAVGSLLKLELAKKGT